MSLPDRVAQLAPHLLVYLDRELRVRFANVRCDELFGCPAQEIRGRLLAELVDAATLRYALAHLAEIERGNAAPREYLLRDKDGARMALQVHASTDFDEEGRAIGYVACAQSSGIELGELVADAVCGLEALAAERGVRIEVRAESGAARVPGSGHELGRALARLIGAAVERSGPAQAVRVQVGALEDRASVAVYDPCALPLASGHLGVSIARACIERLGGTVSVACSDAGAAIRAELPRLGPSIANGPAGAP
jgi:signal transduction histidine kinase